ncbi:MAG: hypothetical protein N4A49_07405 [Marinifilaceae bacterium]|nr:hypothetical protein [Marinifilaceae bacterium]
MLDNQLNELIGEYKSRKIEGMSYSEIRRELLDKGYDKLTVTKIIDRIDNEIIASNRSFFSKNYKFIGWTLMLLGGIFVILYFFKYRELLPVKNIYVYDAIIIIGYLILRFGGKR